MIDSMVGYSPDRIRHHVAAPHCIRAYWLDLAVQFLRPVKGLSAKDLAIYAHANGLDTVFLPNFLTKTMAKDGGVTRLTQGSGCSCFPGSFVLCLNP